jgi:spermidine synthase
MHLQYTEIDRERTALGELVLRRYEAETGEVGFEILIDGNFLMATHGAHSEIAMAALAHERLGRAAENLTVLVGGLGAGHTLRAALDLPGVTRVVVAEIGAKVVTWNRKYFASINNNAADDPRVLVRVADVAGVVAERPGAYDLMLLDVDNGPGWLAAAGNAALYESTGVRACSAALRAGGVLAVWSPQPNPAFFATLQQIFPNVEQVDTTAIGKPLTEPGDTIYLARR